MPGFDVTATSSEQLTVTQLKTHLRVLTDDDDTYIALLGTNAREYIEYYTNQAMVPKTVVLYMENFPAGDDPLVFNDYNPLQSVSSIVYLDEDGTSGAMSTADYNIDTHSRCGRIYPAQTTSWPGDIYSYPDHDNVWITFGCGHTTATCPEAFRHAEKMLVEHWYKNRSPVSTGPIYRDIPLAVNAILDPLVITRFE